MAAEDIFDPNLKSTTTKISIKKRVLLAKEPPSSDFIGEDDLADTTFNHKFAKSYQSRKEQTMKSPYSNVSSNKNINQTRSKS